MKGLISKTLIGVTVALSQTAMASADVDWPQKPITIIVPSGAGGSSDITARIIADEVSRILGKPIIVDNKPGTSGIIGLQTALRAPADGYTFVIGYPTNFIISPFVNKSMTFEPSEEFVPVAGMTRNEMVVSVPTTEAYNNPGELVQALKGSSDGVAYGSYGVGSYPHLVGNYLALQKDLKVHHIPYKSEADMLLGIATGDVKFGISVLPAARKMTATGRTKMIGMISPKRSVFAEDVTTFLEHDIKDPAFQLLGWNALYAKKDVPPAIVQKMSDALLQAYKNVDVRAKFASVSSQPWDVGSQTVAKTVDEETVIYKTLLKSAEISGN